MSGSSSPKDDVDGRRARLRQRMREIAPAATHEYVGVDALQTPGTRTDTRPPAGEDDDLRWTPLLPGEPWGGQSDLLVWGYPADGGSVTWLRARVEVPAGWADDDVLLGLDDPRLGTDHAATDGVGFEGLVHLDGAVHTGMDDWHRAVLLPPDTAGRTVDVTIRCTTSSRRPFAGLRLLRRHRDTWQLGVLARTLLGVADVLGDGDVAATAVVAALDEAYRTLDLRSGWNSESLRRSASTALPVLRAAVPPGSGERPQVTASGHAHLDVAWLWPVWRTRQKVTHTVATALSLMERYPDYHFSLSAPQTWQFLREDAPELFERALERVAQGRLEPVGVFWLESDGNLPSGESYVRQVRHGTRFYRRTLGVVPNAAWLPDSFGFTASLPTILAGFGVRTLMTTKLSWNRVNRMPADTFAWRGPDGSDVLAHFVTSSSQPVPHPTDPAFHTYAGDMSPGEVAGLWDHYRGKAISSHVLYLFGHGDGGGGPTEEMVAAAAVMGDLPGFPQVRMGRAAELFDHLQAVHENASGHAQLPTWTGDLYFEMHRGTLTSQQRTKRGNRDGELSLRTAEWLNAWASLDGAPDRQPELDDAWETVLRNQFHDILPGSAIPVVYEDAAAEHADVEARSALVRADALRRLVGGGTVTVNALPWSRAGVPGYGWRRGDHRTDADAAPAVARAVDTAVDASVDTAVAHSGLKGGGWVLENGLVRVRLDANGEVTSLVDLGSGLESITAGRTANRLVLFEDRPLQWDAWDVDAFYADKPIPLTQLESASIENRGVGDRAGARAAIRLTRRTGATTVVQTLSLEPGVPFVAVRTEVDWHERQMLLRALFPFSPNARHATLGRQFASIEIPVHRNTSWEQARFEVAAHGWLDVGDGAGGVALLTDAIYGHSVVQRSGTTGSGAAGSGAAGSGAAGSGTAGSGGGVEVGLSLLKAGAWPDPHADEGSHVLSYALFPHAGSWQDANVPRRALELAVPLQLSTFGAPPPDGSPDQAGLLRVDADHVIAETVKAAWDDDRHGGRNGDSREVVVRLFEAHNRRGTVTLTLDRPILAASRTDLDENDLEPLPVDGSSVTLAVRPHELLTVRLRT